MLPLAFICSVLLTLLSAGAAAHPSLSKRLEVVCLPTNGEPPFPVEDCMDALKLMENSETLASYEPAFYGSALATFGYRNQLDIPLLGARGTNDAGNRFTIPRTYSYGPYSMR